VLAGTAVQLAMGVHGAAAAELPLRARGVQLRDRASPRPALMLPVTLGLGLINFNLLVNSSLGALVSEDAPRAIDAAFRIYMLPQASSASRSRRCCSRRSAGSPRAATSTACATDRQRHAPDAAAAGPGGRRHHRAGHADHAADLPARPVRPGSTELVATALFWFSFSLPSSGVNLLLTRTFFSLQRPWITTVIAAVNLTVNVRCPSRSTRRSGSPGSSWARRPAAWP
jgi:putative peptidoglycan lipid II flippase